MLAAETVQPIEVAWTLLVGIGLCFSAFNAVQAMRDYRVIEKTDAIDGIGRAVIGGTAVSESIRLVKLALLLAVGVLAMFQPQPEHPTVSQGYITAVDVLLLLFAVGLTANTIIAVVVRTRVKRLTSDFRGTPVKDGSPIISTGETT